ncbi:choloylglycine hydrolase [Methanobrevibacter sp.]|uniref:choloylglycine hydrolase n=1 Tax=Methanobrevibacter sp. TaxID=66852 RepID=UPI003D7E2B75
MCTAARFESKDHYFGRNFDYEISYNERVTLTPRNYKLDFKNEDSLDNHHAILGITAGIDSYPLYYDAFNEKGLAMAGLNFDGYAEYSEKTESSKTNLAEFEFIPFILGKCDNVDQAYDIIKNLNMLNTSFNETLPVSPLHWMVADKNRSIVVEYTKDGLTIFDNPVDILTNNPTFDMQLFNLNNYIHVSNKNATNHFTKDYPLLDYSRGMGGLGLPGDYSSMSRFVKAVFVSQNSIANDDEVSSVNQFFHILNSVEQPKGATLVSSDNYEYTIYSSCMNLDKGILYYRTYDNLAINGIDFDSYDLDEDKLINIELKNRSLIN